MNEFLAFLSLFITIGIMIPFVYWLDKMRLKRLIKQYNKVHPWDIKDFKKSTLKDMNKQFIEWQISMFAKNSDGYSQWEKFEEWSG